jgi:hypothetical protein
MKLLFIFLVSFLLVGCGIYGYTSEMRVYTVSVSRIKNNIKTHSSTINYEITNRLEDKISKQYDLELASKGADYQLSGSIEDYFIQPFSIGANEKAYLNRVTLKMDVHLLDQLENYRTANKNIVVFTDYNYNAKRNFGEIKDSINNILAKKAAEEIYNELFLRW